MRTERQGNDWTWVRCHENGHLVATKLLTLVFFNDVFLENMSSDFIWSPDIKQFCSAYKNWTLCVDSFLRIVTTHKHTCGGGDVCRVLSDDGECGVEAELGSGKLCKTDASQNQHGIKVSKTDASRPDHGFKVSRFLPNRSKSACLLFVLHTKCSLLCQLLQVVRAAEAVPTPFWRG